MQDLPVPIYVRSLYFIVSYHWEDLFFHVRVRSEQQKKSHNPISNQKVLADVPCSASASKHWTHTATTQLSEVLSHKKISKAMSNFNLFHKEKQKNICSSWFSPVLLSLTWAMTANLYFHQSASRIPKCVFVQLFAHFIWGLKQLDEMSFILKVSKSKEET